MSAGPLSLRHSRIACPEASHDLPVGVAVPLRLIAYDSHGNKLRTGGGCVLRLQKLSGPPPSSHPAASAPMTWHHVDLEQGTHEVRLTCNRAGEYQLVLMAILPDPRGGLSGGSSCAGATATDQRHSAKTSPLDQQHSAKTSPLDQRHSGRGGGERAGRVLRPHSATITITIPNTMTIIITIIITITITIRASAQATAVVRSCTRRP